MAKEKVKPAEAPAKKAPAKKAPAKKATNENMALWEQVCKTNPGDTKDFKGKGGFQGTAICAQSQRRRATEVFGIYGIGWRVEDESYETILLDPADPHTGRLVYKASLIFNYKGKEGRIFIVAEIELFSYNTKWKSWGVNNDVYKKVRTDALTKGLSELGFNSDIFEGKFDDNKYIQQMREEFANDHKDPEPKTEPKPKYPADNKPAKSEAASPAEKKEAAPPAETEASPEVLSSAPDNVSSGSERLLPDYDEANFDSMFNAARTVVNNPAKHSLNPKHIPNLMGLVMIYKKTENLESMRQFMGSLEVYLGQDAAGRDQTNEIFAKKKKEGK